MIKEALIKKLEGDIEVAKADLKVFLEKPIGVAEHIDYVITVEKKLEALAHAEDKLESLKKLQQMTYTVNDKCIMCKHTDCVEVCPVDCFYEGENMLVINPDECIDCGVCEPECPEDAILPDTDDEGAKWVEFNGKWSQQWAVLTEKKDPMPDHEKHSGEQGRLEKYFKDK